MAEQMMQDRANEKVAKQTVPAGYKQTEVGVIPDDWVVSTMSSLTSLMTNGFVGTAKTHYTEAHDGVTYIQGYNVEANKFNFHGIKKVSAEFHRKNAKSCLRAGDLLMVQTGDVGLVTVVPPELEGANCHALIINRFRAEYNSVYFSFLFNSQQGRLRLKELETGTTMKHINVGDLLNFVVAYPPDKVEQTAIANVLSDTDALIVGLEQLIAKKQAIKTAAMQQLLTGRNRLPQFALRPDGTPKGYKSSELGDIPEDWEIKQIIQFTDCTAGGTPSTSIASYWGGEHPWMSSGELHLKRVFDVSVRITDEGLGNSSTKYVPADSVLIGLAGQGKTRGTVAIAKIPLCTNQSIASVFPSAEHCPEFLFYNLDSRYEELRELSTGDGGRGGLNLAIIRRLKVIFPDKTEQSTIANVLSDMDSELAALEQRLAKARDLKQGMMQQLLTGRIRLPLEMQA